MTKQTKIILAIFLVLIGLGGIFIYFYYSQIDQMVNGYIAEITDCEKILNEDDCYAKNFCAGIYGPSCADCQELEFQHCQKISDQVLAQLDKEKKLCRDTGGEWYRNRLGSFCLCQKNGDEKVFNKVRGCVEK